MAIRFLTDGVLALWQKYKGLSHPEYPFLDKSYSPASNVPCCDFTLDIAQFILSENNEAIWELLKFLGSRADEVFVAQVPGEMSIGDIGAAEIIAAFLLTWRMSSKASCSLSVGTEVIASILASHRNSLTKDGLARLLGLARKQIDFQSQTGMAFQPPTPEEGWDMFIGEDSEERFADVFANKDIAFDTVASEMRDVPPMVRIAIADFLRFDTDYHSIIRFENGYGERLYGCSAEVGVQCSASMDFLETAVPRNGQLPNEITKDLICEELRVRGIEHMKSWTRQKLIGIVAKDENLLRELIQKHSPGLVRVRSQFKDGAERWIGRYRFARQIAIGILSDMILDAFVEAFHVSRSDMEEESAETVLETAKLLVHGKVRHDSGMTDGAALAFPAQELVRVEDRDRKRDWHARWKAAGGRFYGDHRMVATKTDRIWSAISRFSQPFPPFDFDSGMGVRDIDYEEAVGLGVIREK